MFCSALGCSHRSDRHKIPGLTFHRFPKDPVLREAWITAINRKDWTPSKNSALCSQHFSEKYFDRTSSRSTRLCKNAVPDFLHYKAVPSGVTKISRKEWPHSVAKNLKKWNINVDLLVKTEENLKMLQNTYEEQYRIDESDLMQNSNDNPSESSVETVDAATSPIRKFMVDAATSPVKEFIEEERFQYEQIKRELLHSNDIIIKYRKKLKTAQQQARRAKKRLELIKHPELFEYSSDTGSEFTSEAEDVDLAPNLVPVCYVGDSEAIKELGLETHPQFKCN